MFQISNLTVSGNQTSTAVLADGTSVTFTFTYGAAVQRWFFGVSYPAKNYKETGIGLSTNYNVLRRLRNVLPFGLQVLTADGTDPFLANDLDCSANKPRVVVSVLDNTGGLTDVQDTEQAFYSATAPAAY